MYAKHSIKQKISVGMLLISVAMILAFMIVAISYSYQVLLQSAASTAIKELDFAKNNIDNLLSIIENYAVILATDETIQSRLSVSEPDAQTLSINAIALRNQINNIIGTFPRVNAVLLSDRFGNVFDSGVTILHPEEIYPAMQQTQGWQATAPAPYRISVPGSCVQPNAISFTQQINNYRTGAFCGYLTIYIDETYLRSAYSANQDSDQEIFLQSYDDRIISGHCTLYEASRWQSSGFSGSSGFQHYKDTYISYVDYPPLGCFFVYQVQRAGPQLLRDRPAGRAVLRFLPAPAPGVCHPADGAVYDHDRRVSDRDHGAFIQIHFRKAHTQYLCAGLCHDADP